MEVVVEWHGGNIQVLSRILTISPTLRVLNMFMFMDYCIDSRASSLSQLTIGTSRVSALLRFCHCSVFIIVEDKGRRTYVNKNKEYLKSSTSTLG
jgi:hypothetical protein